MRIVIAGSSGFLGTHLSEELVRRGHAVTALVRRPTSAPDESTWDPYAGTYDRAVLAAADVVVNLGGSPLIGNPHSEKFRRELLESRVATTRTLARAVAEQDAPPAFLAGNGISWYGDHGAAPLTEASDSRGHGLLTEVARQWESATQPAVAAGARVCVLRTAPVMDRRSAPLKQLRPLFALALGAKLGDGSQHMPMISLRDWVGAVVHLAEHDDARGPVNLCCPTSPTNAEFTAALAKAVNRPAVAFAPRPLMRLAAGELSGMLLDSVNARPAALEATGYDFRDRNVTEVLRTGLSAA